MVLKSPVLMIVPAKKDCRLENLKLCQHALRSVKNIGKTMFLKHLGKRAIRMQTMGMNIR